MASSNKEYASIHGLRCGEALRPQEGVHSRLNGLEEYPFFFVAWGLWLSGHVLQQSAFFHDTATPLLTGVYLVAFGLLVLHELTSCLTSKLRLGHVLIAVLILLPFGNISSIFIQGMAFVVIGRNVPFASIAKFTLFVLLLLVSMISLFAILGLVENHVIMDHVGRTRYTMGFTYPSRLPNFLLTILLLAVYLYGERIPASIMLVAVGVVILVYELTRSRNPFIFSLLAIVLNVLLRWLGAPRLPKWGQTLIALSFVLSAVACVLAAVNYDPSVPWEKTVNDITSNRLIYSANGVRSTGWTLMGSSAVDYSDVDLSAGYFDSSYLTLVFSFGLIPSALVIGELTRILWRALSEKNTWLVLCMFIVAFHSVLEWELTWIIYTPFLFLLFRNEFDGGNLVRETLRRERRNISLLGHSTHGNASQDSTA